jgi:peptide/nickel transport system substrate-binding protein
MSKRSGMVTKVLSVVTAMAILAGCSGGSKSGDKPAGEQPQTQNPAPAPAKKNLDVTIAMWSPPNNFSPINTDSSYGYFAVEAMFDTLVKVNDKIDFVPKLAEKWDVSKDFTTFTFHLNPKAKWHDGKPVTAKDVVYTFNLIANKETVTNRGATINLIKGTDAGGKADGPVEGVKALDEKTVQFVAKKAVDPLAFLEKVGANIYILPEHVLGAVAPKDLTTHAFFQEPKVGSGPFKFVKYASGQYIEYARNEEYYLGAPKLERLFIRIMQANTAVAALEKGEVDMTAGAGIGEIPIQDWDKVQTLSNMNALTFVTKGYQYMDFNHTRDYFKDPKVRQAFFYGINRKLIVDNLLKGTGVVLESPYTPIYKYVNTNLKPRGFDANQAKKLLTEAGWDFNRELALIVPIGNKVREQSADIIIANLQQVGVKVKIEKMDFPTLQARRGKGDYDMSLIGWSDILDPDVSSQYRTDAVYNNGKYSRPKVDELLDQGATTAEFQARKKIYDELQEIWYNDPNVVYLYSPNALTAVSKRMENVKMSAMGLLWNIHEWDVKQ